MSLDKIKVYDYIETVCKDRLSDFGEDFTVSVNNDEILVEGEVVAEFEIEEDEIKFNSLLDKIPNTNIDTTAILPIYADTSKMPILSYSGINTEFSDSVKSLSKETVNLNFTYPFAFLSDCLVVGGRFFRSPSTNIKIKDCIGQDIIEQQVSGQLNNMFTFYTKEKYEFLISKLEALTAAEFILYWNSSCLRFFPTEDKVLTAFSDRWSYDYQYSIFCFYSTRYEKYGLKETLISNPELWRSATQNEHFNYLNCNMSNVEIVKMIAIQTSVVIEMYNELLMFVRDFDAVNYTILSNDLSSRMDMFTSIVSLSRNYGIDLTVEPLSGKEYLNEHFADSNNVVKRNINGKDVSAVEIDNSEDANKFLEKNKGYTQVDEENGKVYLALEKETDD